MLYSHNKIKADEFNHCLVPFLAISKWTLLVIIAILFTNCKKLVELNTPQTQIVTAAVFNSDAAATGTLQGLYSEMISSTGFASEGPESITVFSGLSADELDDFSGDPEFIEFYTNSLTASNSRIKSMLWGEGYNYIYQANAIIEGLRNSKNISPAVKSQLHGEALFLRAFSYFYLVNLFGELPIALSTDYRVNNKLARNSLGQVYSQIIADLIASQGLLTDDYPSASNTPTTDRIRPSKWAATALLARVYLYNQDWNDAEIQSSIVINNTALFSLEAELDNVFLKDSHEAIWQLMPVLPGFITNEASTFVLTDNPNKTALTMGLVNAFETNDQRKEKWISSFTSGAQTYYYPFKYKTILATSPVEYSMVLRLAEQYLIRAEARIHIGKLSGINTAEADINIIRSRAGLSPLVLISQQQAVLAVEKERRSELFTEYGHRWLDLKRTKRADAILSPIKSPNWALYDTLYPIPQSEIITNSLLKQNPGY